MSNRVSAVLAACLYLVGASQLHAEIPSLKRVAMLPKAGKLIPTPTFFVVARAGLIPKALALSDGELYLAPLETNEGPEVHSVPLTVTQRYRHGIPYDAFLELSPAEPLVIGVSYELRAKAGTAAEFVDMGIGNNTGKVWKVVPPAEDSESTLHKAAPTLAHYAVKNMSLRSEQLDFVAVLEDETDGISGVIAMGKDKDGKLLNTNYPGLLWTSKTRVLLAHRPCFLDHRSWTHLRTMDLILLGTRGERSKKTIPARVNPVVTSVFGSLPRMDGESRCKGSN